MVQTVMELKKLRIHLLCITLEILAEKGKAYWKSKHNICTVKETRDNVTGWDSYSPEHQHVNYCCISYKTNTVYNTDDTVEYGINPL